MIGSGTPKRDLWLVGAALAVLSAAGCMRDNGSATTKADDPSSSAGAAKKAGPGDQPATEPPGNAEPGDQTEPPGQKQGDMSDTTTIKALASVEHLQADGSYKAYNPERPVPTPIKAGDRLRVRLQVADDAWLYAVAAHRQAEYWQLGAWGPGEGVTDGVRVPWPDGLVLSDEQARMTTLFIVASSSPLDWAKNLSKEDCSALVGQMPPDPPKTACDHLYGLFWKVPGRPRGMVPPPVEYYRTQDGTKLPAIVASHSGSPYVAVEWQFKPRN